MRCRQRTVNACYLIAIAVVVQSVGCAALRDDGESIIRVRANQDPVKAARLTLVGVSALQQGDVDRARDKFIAAVEADEAYGPAHNNLGLLHYDQGNMFQAVTAFEQAMELMPYDPAVYYNLALTLEAAGKVHEALDLYWQAVEMDPLNPNFLGNLVRLRIRLDETGPELIAQLQDLILIETRADWRRWADRQLALVLNESLDRGPETPEFNTRRDRSDDSEESSIKKVIDLSPSTPSRDPSTFESNQNEAEIIPAPLINEPKVRSKPLPIRDAGSFETLPPSIDVLEVDDYWDSESR